MSANPGTKKVDALLAQVMAAIHRKTDAVPEGFRTIDQWARHWCVSRTMASRYVYKALDLGLMEKKSFLVVCRKDARPYPTAHFREVKAKGKRTK